MIFDDAGVLSSSSSDFFGGVLMLARNRFSETLSRTSANSLALDTRASWQCKGKVEPDDQRYGLMYQVRHCLLSCHADKGLHRLKSNGVLRHMPAHGYQQANRAIECTSSQIHEPVLLRFKSASARARSAPTSLLTPSMHMPVHHKCSGSNPTTTNHSNLTLEVRIELVAADSLRNTLMFLLKANEDQAY